MKISVIHPLKHHCYYSAMGIKKLKNNKVEVILGYYNKNDIIDKIIYKTSYKTKLNGYINEELSENVKISMKVKINFLLSKVNNKFNSIYMKSFEKFAIKSSKDSEIIHVLQDYCNNVIRNSKESKKILVYEQIIAFDTTIERYLRDEINKWGFDESYLERNYNLQKIELSKENIKNADYIISPSKYVSDSIIKEFDESISNKIIQFPYGVDVNKFRYIEKNYNKDKLNILCVSRATLTKGTKYLIEAMKKIKNKNIKLTFIGLPVDKEDYRLVEELNNLNNIEYIPYVAHGEINEYFEKSDIFLLPSLIEGSALSIYEAMACGLPCIVTENCGSLVEDQKQGIVIKAQSVKDIIEKIEYCYNNKAILNRMSLEARKTACSNTWDKYIENMNKFYNKISN